MFCKKCGKEIENDAVVCVNCGCVVDEKRYDARTKYNQSKTWVGVLFGLFLGLIGLIIGLCIYPDDTLSRKTFIKSWLITFFVCLAIEIVCYIVYFVVFGNMVNTLSIM